MEVQVDQPEEFDALPLAAVRGSTPARRTFALATIFCGLIGLVPAFIWLAPASHWHRAGLLIGLWGLAGCTMLGEVALKQSVPVQFHALTVIGVLTLLVAGPIPALIAWLLPDLAGRLLLRRYRVFTPGFAANIASYGWCVLAAAGVLAATGINSLSPAVATSVLAVGFVMSVVNFSVARAFYGSLYQGFRLTALVREEFLGMLAPELAMLAFATLCALLIGPLGVLVLGLVAPAILIPELALPLLARSHSVASLDPTAATRLYVAALASHLGVRGRTRRVAFAAASMIHDPRAVPKGVDIRLLREAQLAAWHADERWDGGGGPAGFAGSRIPVPSRLLAVATAWAELTAKGGAELPQNEAMLALELQSALRFDPSIVQAAGEIISSESEFAEIATFQPKLHTVPVPRLVRAHALPHALAAYRPA
jgi:HD domain